MSLVRNVAPPNLPVSPSQYSHLWQEQYSNVLRLYFNYLSSAVNSATPYGQFYDTTSQTNPVASAVNLISINSTSLSYQTSVNSKTKLYVNSAGVYNVQFSVQLQRSGSGSASDVYLWLLQNGKTVPASASYDTLASGSGAKLITGRNYLIAMNAGDYIQLAWASADTGILIQTEAASGSIPVSPAVIVTLNWMSSLPY